MSVKLTFLGHAGFLISYNNCSVAIDPFLTENPLAKCKASDISCDYVLLTHGHFDHIADAESIAKRCKSKIIAPYELSEYFQEKGIETEGCNPGGKIGTNFGWVAFTQAFHSSSHEGRYLGVACGIIINIGGKTIYHAGDTGVFSDMKLIGQIYHPDVSLLPVGDRFTMGPELASLAAELVGAPIAIPIHHSTWPPIEVDLSKFSPEDVDVKVIDPGEHIFLT